MNDLVERLADLRGHLVYPDAPDLVDAVHRRIVAEGRRADTGRRRVLVAVAVALLVVAVTAVLVVPASRHAVADWLGLRGVAIERSDTTPGDDGATALTTDLHLGRPTTLAAARDAVDFPVTVPDGLGPPTAVFLGRAPAGGRVTLLYAPSATLPAAGRDDVGLLVTELSARLDEGVFRKVVGTTTGLDAVSVDGRRGIWIDGRHTVGLVDRDGRVYRETTRLAASTLLVEDGDRTLRLESALDRASALAIARTLLAR